MPHIAQWSKEEIIDAFSSHVSSGKARTWTGFGMPFVAGRREGVYLWDVDGRKRLLDCHCNGGVFNLGHRNPVIIQALKEALEELDIGNHHLISEHRARLAKRLAELAPGNLPYTTFAVGGGEAIDFAIKLARAHTRRPKIISAKGGYHGHTGLALAAGDPEYREPFGPLAPGFVQVPFGDIQALAHEMDGETAAVLLETIPATLGMPIAPQDYFGEVRELCDRHGALLILDEVQSGLGRTGKFWAIEHWGVEPDILVAGKGLSGGIYPIASTSYREELNAFLDKNPFIHISTFGGAELGCVVALKVLEETAKPEFLEHVRRMASFFEENLERLRRKYPNTLVEIRQKGLMIGLVFPDHNCGPLMTKLMYENGVLALFANNDRRVLQFLPPLVITEEEATEALNALDRSIGVLEKIRKFVPSGVDILKIEGPMRKLLDAFL